MTKNRELSIFIDESGELSAPCQLNSCKDAFYMVSLVFHNQNADISGLVDRLNYGLDNMKIPCISRNHALHSYNLIRGERPYQPLSLQERRKLFNKTVDFANACAKLGVAGRICVIDRRKYCDPKPKSNGECQMPESGRKTMEEAIRDWLDDFIRVNRDNLRTFDTIKVYYDNGQKWLGDLIHESFNRNVVEDELVFKEKVSPAQYKLFQVADLLCTYSLLREKRVASDYTKTDMRFFDTSFKARRHSSGQSQKGQKDPAEQQHDTAAMDRQIDILARRFKNLTGNPIPRAY